MKFRCANCFQRIRIDDKWAGAKVRCPGCAQVVVAPTRETIMAQGGGPSGGSSSALPLSAAPIESPEDDRPQALDRVTREMDWVEDPSLAPWHVRLARWPRRVWPTLRMNIGYLFRRTGRSFYRGTLFKVVCAVAGLATAYFALKQVAPLIVDYVSGASDTQSSTLSEGESSTDSSTP